jgi:hypothetical protein
MKIKDGFILRSIAGSNIIVPIGQQNIDFNGIMTVNETGMFLWDLLLKGAEKEELLKALLSEYEVDEATASKDIDLFISRLEGAGLVE